MTFDYVSGFEADALLDQFGLDHRDRFSALATTHSHSIQPTISNAMVSSSRLRMSAPWQLPLNMTTVGSVSSIHSPTSASGTMSLPEEAQPNSPPTHSSSASSPHQQQLSPYPSATMSQQANLMNEWLYQQQQSQQQSQDMASFLPQQTAMLGFSPYAGFSASPPMAFMHSASPPAFNADLQNHQTNFGMAAVQDPVPQSMPWTVGMGVSNWTGFEAAVHEQPSNTSRVPSIGSGSHSPTGTMLEVGSLGSGSDQGWSTVNYCHPVYDSFSQAQHAHNTDVFNPSTTLHLRNTSDSSQSEVASLELSQYEHVSLPYSPSSELEHPYHSHRNCFSNDQHRHQPHEIISPSAVIAPMAIKGAMTSRSSPPTSSGSGVMSGSSASPPSKKGLGPRKTAKPTKTIVRRNSNGKKDSNGEKKVGRRRGPLLPEQRKQASEIRKLRACLRCKFLKKTCDKGEPCAGCQPSHARLWQVPCTRIDIKDVSFFMKDWKADYERHLDVGMSVYNVKGFAPKETLMWITHGYGFALPVMTREIYVTDPSCFQVDWVESHLTDQKPIEFELRTEKLDVGRDGISLEALSEYLDQHLETFEDFVDNHFEGTPFITDILKTAHRYYMKEKSPVIRKALKLVLAYNLTLHITTVEQSGSEEQMEGHVDDDDSKYYGKTVAPVMINFQIKCAMAEMWRELQKEVLEELSSLYSSVYSGDRLKNWPTIFMLAAILLTVWEEMQFDCHYRVLDPVAVDKFCNDMETVPVGVIVGLFHAISQKLPAFTDWDTKRHGQLLNNNVAVCEAMTEVREHVIKHETYLRTRPDTKFERDDFDSLSNKFLSKLVIRAN